MTPLIVSANQKSSAMAVRDRLFLEGEACLGLLERLRALGVGDALVLSTCDRTEVVTLATVADEAHAAIVRALAEHGGFAVEELIPHLSRREGLAAVRHLFRVTASLESTVVGEPHVLGQLKASLSLAIDLGMCGPDLGRLAQAAISSAKRVRRETAIGMNSVSIATAAVELARRIHGDLRHCAALLIGSSEMGELIMTTLAALRLGQLSVTHPRRTTAESLARVLDCHVSAFEDLGAAVAQADIVVSALGGRSLSITPELVRAALRARRNRPLFLIDAAVPGDIDPAVDRFDAVFLYSLDDLERVARDGKRSREDEAGRAQAIIEEEVRRYVESTAVRAVGPLLADLRQCLEQMRLAALADAGYDAEKATRLLINRLFHGQAQAAREAASGPDEDRDFATFEHVTRKVFGLVRDPKKQ